MPVVLRIGPYTFLFYASDGGEPIHVHVRRENDEAKVWIEPQIRLERQRGFSNKEINVILRLVAEYREQLTGAWHEYFGH